jgi:hypothetical protein
MNSENNIQFDEKVELSISALPILDQQYDYHFQRVLLFRAYMLVISD